NLHVKTVKKTGKLAVKMSIRRHQYRGQIHSFSQPSIRVEFVLITAFVFNQIWIVFTVVRVLFFVYRMDPASVLSVAVRMSYLCPAGLDKTTPKLGYPISSPHVDVERVELMVYRCRRFGDRGIKAFDFVRRSHEQSEILRHLPFNSQADIEEHASVDYAVVKLFAEFIATQIK